MVASRWLRWLSQGKPVAFVFCSSLGGWYYCLLVLSVVLHVGGRLCECCAILWRVTGALCSCCRTAGSVKVYDNYEFAVHPLGYQTTCDKGVCDLFGEPRSVSVPGTWVVAVLNEESPDTLTFYYCCRL